MPRLYIRNTSRDEMFLIYQGRALGAAFAALWALLNMEENKSDLKYYVPAFSCAFFAACQARIFAIRSSLCAA